MRPEVSVVIPTYNRRAMVTEAIASVLAQEAAPSFELIVIDDGSDDGTWTDLEERAFVINARPTSIRMKIRRVANRGPAAARNAGAALAIAPLIAFLDSDDRWKPDKLHAQSEYMQRNPACVISQTEEIWIRNGRRVNPGLRHRKRAGDIFVESLRTCLISPSAVMMRTEMFRKVGAFDEDFRAAEDYDLWLRILREHQVGLIKQALVIRHAGHNDQLSAIEPALDRFRILSLLKLLAAGGLNPARLAATYGVLEEKCRIYAHGLRRRGRDEAADFFESLSKIGERADASSSDALDAAVASVRSLLRTQSFAVECRAA